MKFKIFAAIFVFLILCGLYIAFEGVEIGPGVSIQPAPQQSGEAVRNSNAIRNLSIN